MQKIKEIHKLFSVEDECYKEDGTGNYEGFYEELNT